MKKSERELVFNKYGGRCAYCGCELQKGWHIDHHEPVRRKTKTRHQHWKHKTTGEILEQNEGLKYFHKHPNSGDWQYVERSEVPDGFEHPERHTIENMMPACRTCNGWKSTFDLEQFREEIKQQVVRARRYSPNFRLAEMYGLVEETNKPGVFYFELFDNNKTVIV